MTDIVAQLAQWLGLELFRAGERAVTLGTLLYLFGAFIALVIVSGWIRYWISNRLLRRFDVGLRQAVGTIIRYLIIALGAVILVQTAGVDLTALNVLAGAVGIGVGFGLQTIASNFMSGLIILFERPIKVGDRIEVGDVNGVVTAINTRSTTVVTNDNIAIIIPNSSLITENVINWSYTDDRIRFRTAVGVSYGSDMGLVKNALLEAAAECSDVLVDPPSTVIFTEFGDSSLNFELRVWTTSMIHTPNDLRSDLNFRIVEKFRAYGIQIPFPQRDLHVKRWPPEGRPDQSE